MSERIYTCVDCKHLKVIISQSGNYRCYKTDRYIDYEFYKNCEYFEFDEVPLKEKEEKVWG